MTNRPTKNLRERVIQSAETVLKTNGTVGPLELLEQIGFLASRHVKQWMQGSQYFESLDSHIQCGPEKLQKNLSNLSRMDFTKET